MSVTKSIAILFLLSFSLGMAQSQLDSHNYQFKGYSYAINDEITDDEGHHILIGTARITEELAKDRDARLDALYRFSDYAIDGGDNGLIIITDSEYNILKLEGLHATFKKIVWDKNNNCYWIGGSDAHYHKDFYQVSLTKLNAKKEIISTTAVEIEGNTYLQDLILKDKNLVILTMRTTGELGNMHYIPCLMEVSPTDMHDSKNFVYPRKVPNIIHQTELDYPKMYRFDFSPLFLKDGSVYFGLGNAVDKDYGIHFYRYKEGNAEYLNEFGNIDAYHSPYLIGFLPSAENTFLLAYAFYFSKKLNIVRTDAFLQPASEKQTKLAAYPDFNRLLELPDGRLLILSVGKNNYWGYLLFDKSGTLLKEIETSVSEKLHPSLFKVSGRNTILSSFYKTNQDEPTVVQTLTVD